MLYLPKVLHLEVQVSEFIHIVFCLEFSGFHKVQQEMLVGEGDTQFTGVHWTQHCMGECRVQRGGEGHITMGATYNKRSYSFFCKGVWLAYISRHPFFLGVQPRSLIV